MYEILPVDVFGEVALLDHGHTLLRFLAVTPDTVVLLVSLERVRALAERSPAVLHVLAMGAAQRFRSVIDRFVAHLSLSTTSRVAQALLAYARPTIGLSDALAPLPSLTQSEIATRAGTVKEVVSRALSDLERDGAIERRKGHVARLDRAKLVHAAAEPPRR